MQQIQDRLVKQNKLDPDHPGLHGSALGGDQCFVLSWSKGLSVYTIQQLSHHYRETIHALANFEYSVGGVKTWSGRLYIYLLQLKVLALVAVQFQRNEETWQTSLQTATDRLETQIYCDLSIV